jgi:aminoglycoside phosphotransferase (APT) family kinase protein
MIATSIDLPCERLLTPLETCLDTERVLDACREQFGDETVSGHSAWSEARILEALYHPQRYVRVVYALMSDPATPAKRLWPEADLVYLHAPVRRPMSRRGTLLSVGGVPVEAYRFPNDRRLRGLRTFARRDRAAAAWRTWFGKTDGDAAMDETTLQRLLVRYVPEQKWIVRLRAEWSGFGRKATQKKRIAVRASSPATCANLLARHQQLATQSATNGGIWTVPRLIGSDVRRGLLATEWVRGNTLVEELRVRDVDSVMVDVVDALRGLQRTVVEGLPQLSGHSLRLRALEAVSDLSAACPDLQERLETVQHHLTSGLENHETRVAVTVHNDFHWNQLSIKQGRIAILDLERMAVGDATIDVAGFATQLQMLGWRLDVDVDAPTADLWRATFLSCWNEAARQVLDPRLFHCLAAVTRLDFARGMLRHLRPNWRTVAEQCVSHSLDDLARMTNGERVS